MTGGTMGDGFHNGDHVHADFGDGPVISHYVSGPETNEQGEVKHVVQAPDGSRHALAHREPGDREGKGSGLTFWKLG